MTLKDFITGVLLGLLCWVIREAWRQHRAPRLCGTCRYFDDGACKRYPPIRVCESWDLTSGVPVAKVDLTMRPVVRPEQEWCGEYVRK